MLLLYALENHPLTIQIPSWKMGIMMAAELHRLRDRVGDTEKITINLGYVDLGRVDLLVQEGFYSNRTDFIRTAIRNRLAVHADEVKKSIVRHTLELGVRHYTRADLEAVKAAGEKLQIKVLGLATIDPDVTPALALATIESITVLGVLHASEAIKSALAARIA
jgi:Arc/MetJ-type ribon-helix-helix transcriptional regulator